MLHGLRVQVFRLEDKLFGIEQFRSDERNDKMFKVHTVVAEEAAEGKGKRGEDAHRADLALAHHAAQQEIHRDGHDHRQQRKEELSQREPEKQALVVVADFFIDAYFDRDSPPCGNSSFCHIAYNL